VVAAVDEQAEASSNATDDEGVHRVCCLNHRVSFCGLDVEDAEWAEDDAGFPCFDCEVAVKRRQGKCPFGKTCPE
jgi:hypothetical protein